MYFDFIWFGLEVYGPINIVKVISSQSINLSTLPVQAWFSCLVMFVCVEVLQPSQSNGVMSSAVSLPNHMFTGQA